MAMFSPFGDYNDDGTPRRVVTSGFTVPRPPVAPTSTATSPIADPHQPPAAPPPPRVPPAPPPSAQVATPAAAAPPAYRAPAPPSATGDYATDAKSYQDWMDSYGRFDPEVTSGRAGYRAPQQAPAASAAPAYSLTYGGAPPPPPVAPSQQSAAPQRSDDEIMAWLESPGGPLAPGTEITPELVAAYRNAGASQAIDAQAQQRVLENNALRAAQTASMGQLVSGPMSTPVSNPAETFARFAQSGYTGAQALADGWGTGTGTPGWMLQPGYWNQLDPQGRMGAPYVNQAPLVPPTPPAPPPPTTSYAPVPPPPAPVAPTADPYHPPGYTLGVAAQPPAATSAPPVADPYRPQAGAPPPRVPPPGAVVDTSRTRASAPPVRQGYNPTATPNIPGQPVTDFTYPVNAPRTPSFTPSQRTATRGTVSRQTERDLGGGEQ